MQATQTVPHATPQSKSAVPPTALYGGALTLDFNSRSHTYTVTDERGARAVPSVTQILSVIDKSGALTQWAANMTTEFIRAAIRPGCQYDEVQLGEILEQARFNFRSVSRQAKSIGQLAHEWIEAHLRARLYATPELPWPVNTQARSACQAAAAWIEQHFHPRAMEHRLYSLEHDYAGTLDVFGEVDGASAVVDWKASSAVYREFRLQTAAYAQAWAEMHDDRVPDRWVICLDKESGEFEAVKFPREQFRLDLRAFLAAKVLHQRLEGVKRPNGTKPERTTTGAPKKALRVVSPAPAPTPATTPVARPRPVAPETPANGKPCPPAARADKGRNGHDRRITYERRNGSLILTGATFPIRDTLKNSFQAAPHKNGNGWEWEAPAACLDALASLCTRAGIRLVPVA
jgi:hypothetical protein